MFVEFFYNLKRAGVPVNPTSFLRLHKAMQKGLVNSLPDFYAAARSILIKSERYFDLYDMVFAHQFQGAELEYPGDRDLEEAARMLLEEWLKYPKELARALGIDESELSKLSPDELIQYFLDRLKEQEGEHHGGNRWIGTGGTSPVGHSGFHPGGMRVGGVSGSKQAVKVAMSRRYRDYSQTGLISASQISESLKRLKHLAPEGPKDRLNIDETIRKTVKNGGEIELIFERSLRDRLKVILAIDNGGWSMDPYVEIVQTLFNYARAQFKDLKIYYFHNTIYGNLWEDAERRYKPFRVEDLSTKDPETRFIVVGDASMAPWELTAFNGSINYYERSGRPSFERLQFIRALFRHSVWLNPKTRDEWPYTQTINMIRRLFPMFELTLDGLEQAVNWLVKKR